MVKPAAKVVPPRAPATVPAPNADQAFVEQIKAQRAGKPVAAPVPPNAGPGPAPAPGVPRHAASTPEGAYAPAPAGKVQEPRDPNKPATNTPQSPLDKAYAPAPAGSTGTGGADPKGTVTVIVPPGSGNTTIVVPPSASGTTVKIIPGGNGQSAADVVGVQGKQKYSGKVAPLSVSQVTYNRSPQAAITPEQIDEGLDAAGIAEQDKPVWRAAIPQFHAGESGGNPNAVNLWDSNAWGPTQSDGAPLNSSRGGMQTIPSTFAANHAEGTSTDIYDPVANTAAGVNYLKSRYGIGSNGQGMSDFLGPRQGGWIGY